MRRLCIAGGVLLVSITAGLVLWHLGRAPLWDYDEATYAQVTHEALSEGYLWYQTLYGAPYLEKPPLYTWLSSATSIIFGEGEFAMRLPSALSAVALVALVMLLAFELSGEYVTALVGGAILIATAPVIETARQARLDVLVTFFIVLAVYALVRGMRARPWLLVYGLAVAFAILTKSFVAFFALAAAPLVALWFWRFDVFSDNYFWGGAGLGLAVTLPWHLSEYLRYGKAFWQEYVQFILVDRVREDLFNFQAPSNRDYVWYLANFAAPWAQVAVLGALPTALWWRDIPARVRAGIGLCASMALLVIIVFFTAATKAPTYLLPLYPFAAIAIALVLTQIRPKMLAAVCIAILLTLGFSSTIYNAFHFNPYYHQADELAREEKLVAADIAAHPSATWYVYGNDRELGAIMYYTQRLKPLSLEPHSPLRPGDLVLLYAPAHAALYKEHPLSTVALYSGEELLLLEVVSED